MTFDTDCGFSTLLHCGIRFPPMLLWEMRLGLEKLSAWNETEAYTRFDALGNVCIGMQRP